MNLLHLNPDFNFDLLIYAFLTIIIEVPVFAICGYRKLKYLIIFALINLCSNLLLNEFLLTQSLEEYNQSVFWGELLVLLLEYSLCACLLKIENYKKLALTILLTNSTSFFLGFIFFW